MAVLEEQLPFMPTSSYIDDDYFCLVFRQPPKEMMNLRKIQGGVSALSIGFQED